MLTTHHLPMHSIALGSVKSNIGHLKGAAGAAGVLKTALGIKPDMTMGHSLGEYGALVAAGAMPFENGLDAVSARGRGMTRVAVAD
jgi:acyl transferase domain-containing protein